VLLAFVPFALEDATDAVLDALCHLSVKDGKVDPLLLKALADELAARRAAAALVVGAFGTEPQREQVRRLLDDADARVRFRAAQGLLAVGANGAVPVLIGLLAKGERTLAERAELLLLAVAEADAPKTALGTSDAERQQCHAAWLAWWQQSGAKLRPQQRVALEFVNGPAAAKKAAADFVKALLTRDRVLLERVCSLPFTIPGEATLTTLTTREELLKEFGNADQPNLAGIKVVLDRVVAAREFMKSVGKQAERDFLASLPRAGVYIVSVTLTEAGQPQEAVALIVRVSGNRAWVVGLIDVLP
jgi:hypothetical protein